MKENIVRKSLLKSKQRVNDHGEVFTSEREVKSMLDMVIYETENIDSRFLEPACGNGNFLAEILLRKLRTVEKRYNSSQIEFERYSFTAASSIYGIDLLEDNVIECRNRLLIIFNEFYYKNFKNKCNEIFKQNISFVLSKNVLNGNALTLKSNNSEIEPLVFSEWSRPRNDSRIKRRDFLFEEILMEVKEDIFSEKSIETGQLIFIPKPIKEFPLTPMLSLTDYA